MPRALEGVLLIIAVVFAAFVDARPSFAGDGADTTPSRQLFIDQRRLPEDAGKTNQPPPPPANGDEQHKAEEQRKLDELAAKLKAQEEELAAREAVARKKFEELKRLSAEEEVKRKEDEEQLRAREAEAQKQVEEAKRLADETRRKLQEDLKKQSAQKATSDISSPAVSSAIGNNAEKSADAPAQLEPRATLSVPAIALTCPDATVAVEPLPGGRSKIAVHSPCRHGQDVNMQYGPIAIGRTFNDKGDAEFIADMFLGPEAKTGVSLADGQQQRIQLATGDLDEVTKVAVIWNAPVDLSLHAFEYAAMQGEPGDVWSGAPRNAVAASELITKDGRGHGFMSSISDGKAPGPKAEVFTFWHGKQQSRGVVAMALDYETRGTNPNGDTCGSGRYAQVPIEVIVRETSGAVTRQNGLIASVPCGQTLSSEARYQTGIVPDIRIHNTH